MKINVHAVVLCHLRRFPCHQVGLVLGMGNGEADAMHAVVAVAFSGIRIAQQHSDYQRSFVGHRLNLHTGSQVWA